MQFYINMTSADTKAQEMIKHVMTIKQETIKQIQQKGGMTPLRISNIEVDFEGDGIKIDWILLDALGLSDTPSESKDC